MSQESYYRELILSHNMANATPVDTPYRSGHTIDDIPKTKLDNMEQYIINAKYQSLVRSLLWLENATCPDICVATSLLARYALKYLIRTSNPSLQFAHKTNTPLVNFIDFVPAPDATFSDTKWVPQNAPVPSPSQPPNIINANYTRSLNGHVSI
jgi:hypothetical protein